ncbi:MAG: Serine/threonine-protein kinase pkn1 [bacterium ADurb.Bin363]|nr:MAG: Serine/threonine-protein kinase pkn1 [bacterium ADurb.Bin363]
MLLNASLKRKVLGLDTGKVSAITSSYLPPEYYKGYCGQTTDIYALGATMHHLLTGRKPQPFKFSSIKEERNDISIAIDIIIANALDKKHTNRYQTALDMLQALAEIINTPKNMILIPAGSFWMGSNTGEENEKPVHKVTLDSYYIDKYPVTNAEFDKFIRESGYTGTGEWKKYYNKETKNHPVVAVNWFEAIAYAEWAGKRLPYETEWEKAARGNDMRKYPWGNKWEKSRCNTPDLNDPEIIKKRVDIYDGKGTTPVGSFPDGASPYGVMDMAGQVWEWCEDWYDENYYSKLGKACKNPTGPESGEYRVLRGGAWGNLSGACRCTCRSYSQKPDYINFNVGFRCVKDTESYSG